MFAFLSVHYYNISCFFNPSSCSMTAMPSGEPPKAETTNFNLLQRSSLIRNARPLSVKAAKSLLRCAGYCAKDSRCFSFVFAPRDGQCQLHSLKATDIKMAHSEDSSVYVLVQGLDASFGVHSSAGNLMHSITACWFFTGRDYSSTTNDYNQYSQYLEKREEREARTRPSGSTDDNFSLVAFENQPFWP